MDGKSKWKGINKRHICIALNITTALYYTLR